MATIDTFPGVKNVCDTYRSLAQLFIVSGYPGWGKAKSSTKNAPYRTGNLFRRIGSYNTAAKMATMNPTKSTNKVELPAVTISLNFAPPGAKYGYSVHEGKGTNRVIGRRPFAELAANDSKMRKAVNEALLGKNGPVDKYYKSIQNEIEAEFESMGFKKS